MRFEFSDGIRESLHDTKKGKWGRTVLDQFKIKTPPAVKALFEREKKIQELAKKNLYDAKKEFDDKKAEAKKEHRTNVTAINSSTATSTEKADQLKVKQAELKDTIAQLTKTFKDKELSAADAARTHYNGLRDELVQEQMVVEYKKERTKSKEGAEKRIKEGREKLEEMRVQFQEQSVGLEKKRQQLENECKEYIQTLTNKNRSTTEIVHDYFISAAKNVHTEGLVQFQAENVERLVGAADPPDPSERTVLVSDFRRALPALVTKVKQDIAAKNEKNQYLTTIINGRKSINDSNYSYALRNIIKDAVHTFHSTQDTYETPRDIKNKYLQDTKIKHYEKVIDEGLFKADTFLKMYDDKSDADGTNKDSIRASITSLQDQLKLLPRTGLSTEESATKAALEQQIGTMNHMIDIIERRPTTGPGALHSLADRPSLDAVGLSEEDYAEGKEELRTHFLNIYVETIIRQEQAVRAKESFERSKGVESAMKQVVGWTDKLETDYALARSTRDTQKASSIQQEQNEIFHALEHQLLLYNPQEAKGITDFLRLKGYSLTLDKTDPTIREQAVKDQKRYENTWQRTVETQEHALVIKDLNQLLDDLHFNASINDTNHKLDGLTNRLNKLLTQKADFFSETETNSRLEEEEKQAKKEALEDPKTAERVQQTSAQTDTILKDVLLKTNSTDEAEEIDKDKYLEEVAQKKRTSLETSEGARTVKNFVDSDSKVRDVIESVEIQQHIDDLADTINAHYGDGKKPESSRPPLDQEAMKVEIHNALSATVDCYIEAYRDEKADEEVVPDENFVAALKKKVYKFNEIANASAILLGTKTNSSGIDEDDASRKLLIRNMVKVAAEYTSKHIWVENAVAQEMPQAEEDFINARTAKIVKSFYEYESSKIKKERISAAVLSTMVESARLDAKLTVEQDFREQELKKALQQKITPEVVHQLRQAVKDHPGSMAFFEGLAKEEATSTVNTTIRDINATHVAPASTTSLETREPAAILKENIGQEIERYINDYTSRLKNKDQVLPDDQTIERIKSETQYAPAYRHALEVVKDALTGDETAKNEQRATAIRLAFQEAIQHTAQIMAYQKRLQEKQNEVAWSVEEKVKTYTASKKGSKEIASAQSLAEAKVRALAADKEAATYKAIEKVSQIDVEDKDLLYSEVRKITPNVMHEYISGIKGDEARASLQKYLEAFKPANHDPKLAETHKTLYAAEQTKIEQAFESKIQRSERAKKRSELAATTDYMTAQNDYNRDVKTVQDLYQAKVKVINDGVDPTAGETEQETRAKAELLYDLNRKKEDFKLKLDQAAQTRDTAYKKASYDHQQLLAERQAAYDTAARMYPLAREDQHWEKIVSTINALKTDITEIKDLLRQQYTEQIKVEGAEVILPTYDINYTHERHRLYYKLQSLQNEIYGEVDQDGHVIPGREGHMYKYSEAEKICLTAKHESDKEKLNYEQTMREIHQLQLTSEAEISEHEDDEEDEVIKAEVKAAEAKGGGESSSGKVSATMKDKISSKREINRKRFNELSLEAKMYLKKYGSKKKLYMEKQKEFDLIKASKEAEMARLVAVKFEYEWVSKRDDVEDARMFRSRDLIQRAAEAEERFARYEAEAMRAFVRNLFVSLVQVANQNMVGQRNALFAKSNALYN